MFLDDRLVVTRKDDSTWTTGSSLVYRGKSDTIEVPIGFDTDFASVPRFLQWLAPSTGKYTLAAVLHDYLCDSLNDWGLVYPGDIDSRDVDGLFRRVMRELEVPFVQRWFMWTGVRWGALFNHRRRPGILADLPLVLLLSILALPIVLPPSIAIGVSRVIWWVYESLADAGRWFTEPISRSR